MPLTPDQLASIHERVAKSFPGARPILDAPEAKAAGWSRLEYDLSGVEKVVCTHNNAYALSLILQHRSGRVCAKRAYVTLVNPAEAAWRLIVEAIFVPATEAPPAQPKQEPSPTVSSIHLTVAERVRPFFRGATFFTASWPQMNVFRCDFSLSPFDVEIATPERLQALEETLHAPLDGRRPEGVRVSRQENVLVVALVFAEAPKEAPPVATVASATPAVQPAPPDAPPSSWWDGIELAILQARPGAERLWRTAHLCSFEAKYALPKAVGAAIGTLHTVIGRPRDGWQAKFVLTTPEHVEQQKSKFTGERYGPTHLLYVKMEVVRVATPASKQESPAPQTAHPLAVIDRVVRLSVPGAEVTFHHFNGNHRENQWRFSASIHYARPESPSKQAVEDMRAALLRPQVGWKADSVAITAEFYLTCRKMTHIHVAGTCDGPLFPSEAVSPIKALADVGAKVTADDARKFAGKAPAPQEQKASGGKSWCSAKLVKIDADNGTSEVKTFNTNHTAGEEQAVPCGPGLALPTGSQFVSTGHGGGEWQPSPTEQTPTLLGTDSQPLPLAVIVPEPPSTWRLLTDLAILLILVVGSGAVALCAFKAFLCMLR